MTTRLSAVARTAGVSPATVSRVLNGKDGVAPATRDAVLTALDVLGFPRPGPVAAPRPRLIGLVVPDLQNPIFPAFAEALGVGLIQRGLLPVLCTRTPDGVSEARAIQMLLAQQVGGIVFIGSSLADAGAEQLRELKERKLPMLLINGADDSVDVPRVGADDAAAAEQALAHLTAMGHERIGLILGPPGHRPSARKLAGYTRFWRTRRGADQTGWVEHTVFTVEGGAHAASRLVAAGATALICGSDALALGAIRAVRRLGLSVPGDVSVVGFDDSMGMAVTDPPLTTVRQPVQAMAGAAMTLLSAQLEGRALPTPEVLFEPELVVRATTGACPRRRRRSPEPRTAGEVGNALAESLT